MKKLSIKRTTQNYDEFIERFSEKIEYEFPNIHIEDDSSKKLKTSDSRRNLSQTVKSYCTIFQDISFGIIFHPLKDGICIHNFLVNPFFQKRGIGTDVMKTIMNISNEYNIPIYLIPVSTTDYGISVKKLRTFYHSFGYKREKTSVYWKYSPIGVQVDSDYRMVG